MVIELVVIVPTVGWPSIYINNYKKTITQHLGGKAKMLQSLFSPSSSPTSLPERLTSVCSTLSSFSSLDDEFRFTTRGGNPVRPAVPGRPPLLLPTVATTGAGALPCRDRNGFNNESDKKSVSDGIWISCARLSCLCAILQ